MKFPKLFKDLKGYNLDKFKLDLNAGIVTGIVAIPLSLALAIATGNAAGVEIKPIIGLYTAAIAGMVAAVFAGSQYNVSGPAAAMVPILGAVIKQYGLSALPMIGMIAGFILILFGIFKIGSFIKYIPLSVTLGFTAGIAITLFFGQLNSFLGLKGVPNAEHFHEKVEATFSHLSTINIPTILIGLLALSILILLPKVKRFSKIPPSLVAVTLTTALVYFGSKYLPSLHLDQVVTISEKYGKIGLGFPPVKYAFDFHHIPDYIAPALKIAFLISIESLLCAVVADKMTKNRHNSNQELIAQGIANIITPMFSGIPATAVIARTGTAIKNGAQTRIAAFIHAAFVLLFLLLLASLGNEIPLSVLSAVLFITAWKISEQKEIRHLVHIAPKSDILVLFLTLILTVFLDLTIAVGAGMFLMILFIFRKLSTIHASELHEDSEYVGEAVRRMLIKNHDLQLINLEGNLSMGAAGDLRLKVKLREDSKHIIIRLREIHHVDLSGLEALDSFIEYLKEQNKKVYLVSINRRILFKMLKYKVDTKVDGIFENTKVLVRKFS
jgi:SulP family sulfate permease